MKKVNELTSTSQIQYSSGSSWTGADTFTTAESDIGFRKESNVAPKNANQNVLKSKNLPGFNNGPNISPKEAYNDQFVTLLNQGSPNGANFGGGNGSGSGNYAPMPIPEKGFKHSGSLTSCKAQCGSDWEACPEGTSQKHAGTKKSNRNHCDDCYCCQDNDYKLRPPPPHILKEVNNRCNPLKFDPFFKSKYSSSRTFRQPLWMESCGRVLTFFAYYQEPVPESAIENYRIHQCNINYYVDDGSFEVYERKTFDPGFTQGRLIRRHKIPLPPPCQDSFFDIDHIEVGCEVTFYGKTFYVCGCDDMTRQYVNRVLCKPVMPNQELPEDPYTVYRHDQVTSLFARPARVRLDEDKFKRFLSHNQKVLRFWAYWDDRCNEGGVLRKFVVHYYLEDDNIEIKPIAPPNSGLDFSPTFFHKSKLRKNVKDAVVAPDQKQEALLVLNLTGGCRQFGDHTYLADRLIPGIEEAEFYSDKDLAIGAAINVYGRAFVLTDCDEFTKTYYKDMYGIENFTPLVIEEEKAPFARMKTPPHNGIGSEEDTRANWDKIEINPPRHFDLQKMVMSNDVLGFDAKFYKPLRNVNRDRRFIIQFFMADGCIQIFEKGHPNTGTRKGSFLNRTRVIKSGSWDQPNDPVQYFSPTDFYVGNILSINNFNFHLTKADEFTLSYMEKHYKIFPHADTCTILNKLREAVGPIQASDLVALFSQNDSNLQGVMSYADFAYLIKELTQCGMSEHEIITLGRSYKIVAPDPGPDWKTLQSVIQTELRRFNFDKLSLQRIEYTLRYHDPCRLGLVDRQHLSSALKGARMPVERLLIDFLVKKFPASDDCDRINYCEVIKFLNFIDNPAPTATPSSLSCVLKYLEPKCPKTILCVNYRALLESISSNFKCSLPQFCCPSGEESCCQEQYITDNCNGNQDCNSGIDQVAMDRERLCSNADVHRQEDYKAFCVPPSQSDCNPWFGCNYPYGYGC